MMNKRPDNPAPANGKAEPENVTSELQPETLIEFAREYFAADFPNPDRRGCPDRAALTALAQTGRLADDGLRAHLFGCSDCFNEYRTELATRTVSAPAVSWWGGWRDKLAATFTLRPGVAWASVVALLLVVSLLTWTKWRGGSHNPLTPATPESTQAQAPASVPTSISPTPEARVARNVEPHASQSSLAARRRDTATDTDTTVSVDLNEYVALRDVAEASGLGKKVITLTPMRTRLRLRLPEGSLAGRYTVSLIDELGSSIDTDVRVSRDGQWLVATLDLRSAGVKGYRLSLQCRDETPDFYPVLISERKQNKQ